MVDVGRLDPIKGFPEGLAALEYALDHNEELIGRIKLLEVAHDSRLNVPRYKELKRFTEAEVARINAKFRRVINGKVWEPIVHIPKQVEQETELLAMYKAADILRVTSLIDGMNLVIKEGAVVGRDDLALVLGINAGAYDELHDFVYGVDPEDKVQVADAIMHIFRLRQSGNMQEIIAKKLGAKRFIELHDVYAWMDKIEGDIRLVKARQQAA